MVRTGRPLSEDGKKTSINIRVTDKDRELLKDRANKKHMNLSEYVLYACKKELSEDKDK